MTTGDVMVFVGMIVLITALALIDWRLALAVSGLLLMLTGMARIRAGK
jgi:hypothetical protein